MPGYILRRILRQVLKFIGPPLRQDWVCTLAPTPPSISWCNLFYTAFKDSNVELLFSQRRLLPLLNNVLINFFGKVEKGSKLLGKSMRTKEIKVVFCNYETHLEPFHSSWFFIGLRGCKLQQYLLKGKCLWTIKIPDCTCCINKNKCNNRFAAFAISRI